MARILVVDDEPLISLLVSEWLEELNHTVIGPAASEEAALLLLATERPDAAILDVSIRQKDSTAVAAALRDRGIPYALATGHTDEKRLKAFAAAITLSKPFDFGQMKKAVASILS